MALMTESAAVRSHQRMRSIGLALAALLAVTAANVAPVTAAGGNGLRAAANEYRVSHGLAAVSGTALLDDIGTHRARQMAQANKLEHDLDYVKRRLNRSGVCWSGFGEIIAWERGYPDYSYDRVMSLWWNSPPHHEVMMGAGYNAAGAAWTTASDGGHYSVMVFVTLCGASAPDVPRLKPDVTYDPDRAMVFKRGTFTGLKLSSTGAVLARKKVTFDDAHGAWAGGRSTPNDTTYLNVTSGVLAGYWVRESADAYVKGIVRRVDYDPLRAIRLEAGQYTGLHFDKAGRVTGKKRSTLRHVRSFSTSARAIINGCPFFLVESGRWSGYWLRDGSRVTRV
jgi:uncharacterized protein YkwD